MKFFKLKARPYPLIAFAAALFTIAFGIITAGNESCSFFLIAAYIWIAAFGCYKGCLKVLPAFVVFGGAFSAIAYFAYGGSGAAAISMANRFAAVFIAAAVGMSVEAADMTRALSSLKAPRSLTLGMLITTSFVPVLKAEIRRVREAMKTRGAGSVLNPKILYRAFLVPFAMRIVNISDSLSLSVETRGFALGKVKYTVYKKETLTLSDVIFSVGLIAGAVLTAVL